MLSNPDQKDFLMELYTQCNEHAREQPRKRDQVILFYVAVCSFYLSQNPFESGAMFYIMTAALVILGGICSAIVITLRAWTIQYIRITEVIGRILISPRRLRASEIPSAIKKEFKRIEPQETPFFFRMGNLIALAFCFISLAPFAVLSVHFYNVKPSLCIVVVAVALTYFFTLACLCKQRVVKAEKMNEHTWIVNFRPGAISSHSSKSHPFTKL